MVDEEYWSRCDVARFAELAALCVGLDPKTIKWDTENWGTLAATSRATLPPATTAEAARTFRLFLDLAPHSDPPLRLVPAQLANLAVFDFNKVRLEDFVQWARQKRLPLPQLLEERFPALPAAVAAGGGTDEDLLSGWLAICEALGANLGRTPPDERTARRWLEASGVEHSRNGGRVSISRLALKRVRPLSETASQPTAEIP